MWCKHCEADVAGEVSPDAKSLLCTTCGREVSSIRAPGPPPSTHGVREFLERWETEEALDPYQPRGPRTAPADSDLDEAFPNELAATAETDHSHADDAPTELEPTRSTAEPQREARVARRPSQRKFRVDQQHPQDEAAAAGRPHPPRDVPASHGSRVDHSHGNTPAPHFNIDVDFDPRHRPGRGESLWGQLLAYAGVGVLTIGTGLVVWGYFGGPASYAPTGWLLATAGQMLLFLGVVTLISGGMEQTTHEVTQRIERLGDHILRIERHTSEQALRGPHFDTADAPVHDVANAEGIAG